MSTRGLCPACNDRPVAINYVAEGIMHYRSRCDACIRKSKRIPKKIPAWYRAGYRKKPQCEHCGFVAKLPDKQLHVYHVDGNLKNVNWLNLKTVCLNCAVEIARSTLPWRRADLEPDV